MFERAGFDRMDRINRMNSNIAGELHPVDPVHPVSSSSTAAQGCHPSEMLLRASVPPCLRGEFLPTFLMHTRCRLHRASSIATRGSVR